MSARLRLTLSYAGFLMVAGLALVALLVYILRFVPEGDLSTDLQFVPDRSDLLRALWPKLLMVLSALAVSGLVGGWVLAGRMLRPLQEIHTVAREVARGSLAHRVRLRGPHDEFRELADTFDTMLDGLQRAFDEQRRFAANASHELRTPYAIERSMLDVALADPDGVDVPQLVRRLDRTNRRGIETVEALLALTSLERGQRPEQRPVDMAELTAGVLTELHPLAVEAGIVLSGALGEGDVDGSATLIRQLVTNLVLNGVRHNRGPGGRVSVATRSRADGAVQLRVHNTGPVVPAELLPTLTEPFVRGVGRVVAPGAGRDPVPGSGLGLAIVARVAQTHRAALYLEAPPDGGLDVRVVFPPPGG